MGRLPPLLWVFLAGGLGATLRVALGGIIDERWADQLPHVGTLLVNLAGCFLIGLAAASIPNGPPRTAILGGLLGGFTTYSAFALFSYDLVRQQQYFTLAIQLGVHLVGGVLLAAAGMALGRMMFGPLPP